MFLNNCENFLDPVKSSITGTQFPGVDALLGVDQLRHLASDGLDGHESAQQVELAGQSLLHHAVDIDFDQLGDTVGSGGLGSGLDVTVALELDTDTLGDLGLRLEGVVVGEDHQVFLDSALVVLAETVESCSIFLFGLEDNGVIVVVVVL